MDNIFVQDYNWDKLGIRIGFFTDIHLHHAAPRSRTDNFPMTVLDKLKQVVDIANQRQWDILIFGGDLFNTVKQPFGYVSSVFKALSYLKEGIRCYSIVGNHDFKSNLGDLDSSSSGVVLASGVFKHLDSVKISVLGTVLVYIQGMDYEDHPIVPTAPVVAWQNVKEGCSPQSEDTIIKILVAHQFASPVFGDVGAFKKGDFKGKGWDIVLLGHDHLEYPIVNAAGTTFVRPGGLTRLTRADNDRNRNPRIVEITLSKDGVDYEFIPLKVEPASVVFSEPTIDRQKLEERISTFVKNLSKRVTLASGSTCILDMLKTLSSSEEVFNVCVSYLQTEGVL